MARSFRLHPAQALNAAQLSTHCKWRQRAGDRRVARGLSQNLLGSAKIGDLPAKQANSKRAMVWWGSANILEGSSPGAIPWSSPGAMP
jgi:hypothetical protein